MPQLKGLTPPTSPRLSGNYPNKLEFTFDSEGEYLNFVHLLYLAKTYSKVKGPAYELVNNYLKALGKD